jgi:guanylate kinase
VVSGPSGVGKSTVTDVLEERGAFHFSISVTTRPPRPSEVDGEHYRFISPDEFAAMIDAGELLEWAEYDGHHYGTPRAPVIEQTELGSDVLLEIEVQGALQVIESHPDALTIFINPPSAEELVTRLRKRGDMSDESIEQRMEIARREMVIGQTRFRHNVVNDDLEHVVAEILRILKVPDHTEMP